MTTVNGLPAHILLVHAIVVLLPLSALLLVLSSVWPKARGKLAGPNAVLAVLVVILVPITTNAGEWLERRVPRTQLLRDHTELGDTALWVAIPIAVLALVVWWRQRENTMLAGKSDAGVAEENAAARAARLTSLPRRRRSRQRSQWSRSSPPVRPFTTSTASAIPARKPRGRGSSARTPPRAAPVDERGSVRTEPRRFRTGRRSSPQIRSRA